MSSNVEGLALTGGHDGSTRPGEAGSVAVTVSHSEAASGPEHGTI